MKTKSETTGKRIYKRYTPAERQRLVSKYKNSGLTKAAFCREHNIVATTFTNWVKPYNRKKCDPIQFAEVEFSVPAQPDVSAEIVYPDGKVLRIRNFELTEESATFIRRMASC